MERCNFCFSRRDVRAWAQWGDTVLKKRLERLEDMEYLLVHRGGRGQSFVYELVFARGENPLKPQLPGLINVYDLKKAHLEGEKSHPSRPQVVGMARDGHMDETRGNTNGNADFARKGENRAITGRQEEEDAAIAVAVGGRP